MRKCDGKIKIDFMNEILPRLFFLMSLVLSSNSNAIPSAHCARSNFKEIRQLANYFGSQDPRLTKEQYAKVNHISLKDVEKQFSATGKITCPGISVATANIVGRNDLLTTSAHTFYDKKCNPVRNIGDCKFETVFGPKYSVKLKAFTAKVKPCLSSEMNSKDDWAVVELEHPLNSVTPYLIPSSPISFNPGDKVTEVAAAAENFRGRGPNIQECSIRAVGINGYPDLPYITDCSNGHGSSGASQLKPNGSNWELQAVDGFSNIYAHDGVEYDPSQSYFTASAPVSGEFFDVLTEMANKP